MEKKKNFIINIVFYLIICGIAIGICRYILPILIPFILAFLVAGLLQFPIRKLAGEFTHRKKVFAILLVAGFYMILFIVLIGLGTKIVSGAGNVVMSFPQFYKREILLLLNELSDKLETAVASMDSSVSIEIENTFQEVIQNIGQYISEFSMRAFRMISEKAAGIPAFIVKLVIMIVATFFMAVDFDKIIAFIKKIVPKGKEDSINNIVQYVKNIVFIYLRSYSFLFLLTFIELSIGLLLLRIPYAIMIALLIAIFDILPVLGTGGILLPWAVMMVLVGNIPMAIGIVVLYLVITAIRNTLEPRIVGKQIGLHPLATLIVMFIGLKMIGIIGLVCFPVALSVLVNLEKNKVIHIKIRK